MLKVSVEFSGGMELLFGGTTKATVEMEDNTDMKDLIAHIKNNLLRDKPELFVSGDTVRPGILVLINDSDWEIDDGIKYKLNNGDNIVFISTLHGG